MRNTMPSAGRRRSSSRAAPRAACSAASTVAVVHEEHVDVARVVQLGAAELAHADDRDRHAPVRAIARARPRGTPARARRARAPTPRRSATPRRSRAAMRTQLAALPPAERARRRRRRARPRTRRGSRRRSSPTRSAGGRGAGRASTRRRRSSTTTSERDAHGHRDQPRPSQRVWRASSSTSSGWASTTRATTARAVIGSAERSIAGDAACRGRATLSTIGHAGSVAYPGDDAPAPSRGGAARPRRR